MEKKCEKCQVSVSDRNKSGFCRPCYVQRVVDSKKKPIPFCKKCGVEVSRRSKLFLCRQCYYEHYYSDPINVEKKRQTTDKWNAENKERRLEISLNWQKANPEKVKEYRAKTCVKPRDRYVRAIHRSKRRKLTWELRFEEFCHLIEQNCHYCNGKLNKTGVSLDRKDNSKGYVIDNVVPCCFSCNIVKSDILTCEEMVVAMKAVVQLRAEKNGRFDADHY